MGPVRPIRRDFYGQAIVGDQADLGARRESGLEQQRQHVARGSLVQGEAQVAGAALRHTACRPEGLVELGRERVLRIRLGAEAEQGEALQGRDRAGEGDPGGAVETVERVLVGQIGEPPGPRREAVPDAVMEMDDVAGEAGPGAGGRSGGDEVAVALGGRGGRGCQVLVEAGELHEGIEGRQGLVMGHVLSRLPRRDQRQGEVGRHLRHGGAPDRWALRRSARAGWRGGRGRGR